MASSAQQEAAGPTPGLFRDLTGPRPPRPQGLDASGGERAGHQSPQPGVLRRVHPVNRAGGEHLEAWPSLTGRNRQRPGEALVDEHLADVSHTR